MEFILVSTVILYQIAVIQPKVTDTSKEGWGWGMGISFLRDTTENRTRLRNDLDIRTIKQEMKTNYN